MSKVQQILDLKNILESDLKEIEKMIFDLETRYLEDTWQTGNIIKGWDNYLQNKKSVFGNIQRKSKINPQERIFSLSSVTFPGFKIQNAEYEKSNQSDQYDQNERSKRIKKKKNYASICDSERKDQNDSDSKFSMNKKKIIKKNNK